MIRSPVWIRLASNDFSRAMEFRRQVYRTWFKSVRMSSRISHLFHVFAGYSTLICTACLIRWSLNWSIVDRTAPRWTVRLGSRSGRCWCYSVHDTPSGGECRSQRWLSSTIIKSSLSPICFLCLILISDCLVTYKSSLVINIKHGLIYSSAQVTRLTVCYQSIKYTYKHQ